MTGQKLYHYSKEKYDILKTLEFQRKITEEEYRKARESLIKSNGVLPGYYFQHISFFFDPIPRDVYKYFNNNHHVWTKGNKLYEYEVYVDDIKKFKYHIVETPDIVELIYDESVTDEDFYKSYEELTLNKYTGSNAKDLYEASYEFIGETSNYYKKAFKLDSKKEQRMKYAAGVPHVMIYPDSGLIKYRSVNEIILKNTRFKWIYFLININNSIRNCLIKMTDITKIKKQINEMFEKDQNMRFSGSWDDNIDIENTAKMKAIFYKYGLITISVYGLEISNKASIIVQHSDKDVLFQKRYLQEMISKKDDVKLSNIPYLYDRVNINSGKKQKFGTQLVLDKNNKLIPKPLLSYKKVNSYRKEYGLEPLEEYLEYANRLYSQNGK